MVEPLKESQLVNKWLSEKHPSSLQWRRVRLGIVPDKEQARMFSVILRWADAIFIEDNTVFIVEAKLRPSAEAFGQLELYQELFRKTPEFQAYWDRPIKLVFLTMMLDQELWEHAERKGIKYEIFNP